MAVYICTKFHENILDAVKSYRTDTIFIGSISKGHNSVKCRWTYVLVLCTSSDGDSNLYKVS